MWVSRWRHRPVAVNLVVVVIEAEATTAGGEVGGVNHAQIMTKSAHENPWVELSLNLKPH